MTTAKELLIKLLVDLVERVPDQPKRILFKGVSNLYEDFKRCALLEYPEWDVLITKEGADVVGARNDPNIAVLVVFYQAEVRERESLNAFRLFNEDKIAKELVARLGPDNLLFGLSEPYNDDERNRLISLLAMVYPSAERLAEFLLAGKAGVGDYLPLLGFFRDSNLRIDMPIVQWNARLRENQQSAVIRWRDFLDKGTGTKSARQILGDERVALLREAEIDPAKREEVLSQVTLNEALSVLNPPTQLAGNMMAVGFTRKQAEDLIETVKSGGAGHAGDLDLSPFLEGLPSLPDRVSERLEKLAPPRATDGDDIRLEPEADLRRVGFCLESLLRLARQQHVTFPSRLTICRADIDGDYRAELEVGIDGRLRVTMDEESARFLSVPGASGVSELQYEVRFPDNEPFRFSLAVMPRWLEFYAEDWLDADYWKMTEDLNPDHADKWSLLRERVTALRDVVDPDWKLEPSDEEERDETDREPNNHVYAIFDLLYFAHRELFDSFLDAWLSVATLPWRDTRLAQKPQEWRKAVSGLLRLGTAHYSDGKTVVFPYFPLRLAWYRQVFQDIEGWLAQTVQNRQPLVFEPSVLAEQLKPIDRPRVLFNEKKRMVETAFDNFFVTRFFGEDQHQRVRPPLYRSRQKLEQFGRMWPFSLDRLHLAFQPGDAGEDIYRLLVQESEVQPDAAYRVRAMVESSGITTIFDRELLSTSDDTVDLLTQEHYESILPRVEYGKIQLGYGEVEEAVKPETTASHITLLIDAFSEDAFDFGEIVGKLNMNPDWMTFNQLAQDESPQAREELGKVDISAPPYHTGPVQANRRDLVYVPLSGNRPEYLRMLYDTLMAWQYHGAFNAGVYFERVLWNVERLQRMHDHADWVLLFDRTLDKSLFETLIPGGVKLIDYYPNLPGGYKMSVSSRRTAAVEWQLAQVLWQFFPKDELDVRRVAQEMLDTLSDFASGLLLKTLGGGSLAQEMLGLYATYLTLIAEDECEINRDWLIPLDDYQSWFGRRTQRGRRADLMVLRNPTPDVLRLIAVESKWYKRDISKGFAADEFGKDGQMRTTVTSLRSLFDPIQDRLDKHYWQKMLASLLDTAPNSWQSFRERLGSGEWRLEVDGLVYVHQYEERDVDRLRARNEDLQLEVTSHLTFPADLPYFSLGPDIRRLRLKARDEIVELFSQVDTGSNNTNPSGHLDSEDR